MSSSALYIGAGTDFRTTKVLFYIDTFYYVDSQPNSEFGFSNPNTKDLFYRPKFINKLNLKAKKYGFELLNFDGNLRIYSNGKQTVYYYTNTAIPEHYENIKDEVKNFDTLIIKEFLPNKIILNGKKKIHFIGFDGTNFRASNETEPSDTVIKMLHQEKYLDCFNKFTYIHKDEIRYSFNCWELFYRHFLIAVNKRR